jgi:hypothetical protein
LELTEIKFDNLLGNDYTLEDIAGILGGEVEDSKILVERDGYIFTIEDLTITDVNLANIKIAFSLNGKKGIKVINTIVTVTDNKEEVDPSSLQYGWSNSKEDQPTEWISFTSGQTITKDIAGSTEVHFLWVKAKDKNGTEQIKRSNQFNDIDETTPTIVLSKTGDTVGSASAEITAAVTYGFSGVEAVK